MRKAKNDHAEVKAALLKAAEQMMQETLGRRLVMSELASRVGLTQSYAHHFFATKEELVRALAARWFDQIETALLNAQETQLEPEEKLKFQILILLQLKRAKFDESPELFKAYLTLASEHLDIVHQHTKRLNSVLEKTIAELVPFERVPEALQLVEDATVLFRVPHNIAMFRSMVTDQRAEAVIAAVVVALRNYAVDEAI